MTKKDFEAFVDDMEESSLLITSNLNRAADLVQSFKKVAVDRSSDELREFNVKIYVSDILQSLKPSLKKTKHSVDVDCPDDLKIKSYPGALSQIFTNLIMNSIVHGFEGIDGGKITISIMRNEKDVIIIYKDDGVGISRENINRIFEPFYTTKRGTGGSGLGLNITMNLVTNTLNGSIVCDSDVGKGVKFTITFPSSPDDK